MAKPKPAPVYTGKPAPKTGMAGLYGGAGPTAYVNNQYRPIETANQTQQAQRLAALQNLLGSFNDTLKQPSTDYYGAAASDATTAANNAAQSLAAANPNAATQAMLRAIGAPQAQQDQVASQNNTVFNGQGALQQYVSGAIPAGVFAADAQARGDYLKSLPLQLASIGAQGVAQLGAQASKENQAVALQKIQDLQKARTDLANFVQTRQKTAFDQAATTARLNQADQRLGLQAKMDAFNQTYKINSQKLSAARLNLSARRFAQQTLQSDRSFSLQLKKFGVYSKSLQSRALQQEYKLKNGGFTPSQLNKINTDSAFVISQAKEQYARAASGEKYTSGDLKGKPVQAPDYQTIVAEMLSRHVPLSVADKAIRAWNPTLRGTPPNSQLLKDYNEMTGVGVKPGPLDVVTLASGMLGTPYVWGGNSPGKALDCSAFIQQAYARVGVKIPRTTYAQVKAGRPVSLNQLQPGDAVFTEPGKNGPNHVGLYIGNGQVQESPHTGDVNKIIPLSSFLGGGFVAARRYLP